MTNETTPVAKSLHTIKVIQQVARAMVECKAAGPNDPRGIKAAMIVLGLAGRPDPYGLEEKALRLMKD